MTISRSDIVPLGPHLTNSELESDLDQSRVGCKIEERSQTVKSISNLQTIRADNSRRSENNHENLSSLSEYSDIPLNPHSPPFPISATNLNHKIRDTVVRNHRVLQIGTFQEYMEERLVRWRPGTSNQGTDAILNGTHPFQSNSAPHPLKSFNFITAFQKWWFTGGNCNQNSDCVPSSNPSFTIAGHATSVLVQEMNHQQVSDRYNDSNPIEGSPTPTGIPLYDLNFDKSIQNSAIEPCEEDYDFIDATNFLTFCFQGKCIKW